ncbi:MAG: NAD(P)/FAD-dependent oxidoreductase, partial [Methyloprofundus sp.]|nr:NAD(P)/FAD-dependent oxidoreductase [Methyloprofundus sp.]
LTDQKQFNGIEYDGLLLTTGCYERATPFPGWTLPGVMNLGGAQLQIKNNLVTPGNRIVVCGTGPLLPVATEQFKNSGMDVVGMYEANTLGSYTRNTARLLRDPALLLSGLKTLLTLLLSDIDIKYGWGIVEARGDKQLEEVVVAPYDKDWNHDSSRKITLAADCLVTGYGFVPRTELSRLLELKHHVTQGGMITPVIDQYCRTSKENIYIAGDAAAINGGKVAALMGRLMALTYLLDKKILSEDNYNAPVKKILAKVDRYKKFTSGFGNYSFPRSGLLHLVDEETIVCRCENVKRKALDEALSQGVVDLATMKMVTRAGMGECQAKICGPFCGDYMRMQLKREDVGELKPRFPLAPVPFSAMPTTDQS